MAKTGRTNDGRFSSGHEGYGGRPRSPITAALKRQADPDEIAKVLIAIANDPNARAADRIAACKEILDRVDGKAPSTIDLRAQVASAHALLPANWSTMNRTERERALDDLRQRALAAAGVTP